MQLNIKDALAVLLGKDVQERVIYRLDIEQYRKLEKNLRAPLLNSSSDNQEAAFLLGIQYVLKVIRDGF